MTDALNRVTNIDYDATGRRTKITKPPSAPGGVAIVTEFANNLSGELTSVKDAHNKVTQFLWNPSIRRTTTTFSNTTTEISDYNEVGELVSFTNRSVHTQTKTYNANGWLLTKIARHVDRHLLMMTRATFNRLSTPTLEPIPGRTITSIAR